MSKHELQNYIAGWKFDLLCSQKLLKINRKKLYVQKFNCWGGDFYSYRKKSY